MCRASVHLHVEAALKSTNICTNNPSSGKLVDPVLTDGRALLLPLLGWGALHAGGRDVVVFHAWDMHIITGLPFQGHGGSKVVKLLYTLPSLLL